MTEILQNQLQTILTPAIDITRVSQGAEAVVYRTTTHPYLGQLQKSDPSRLDKSKAACSSFIIKYRPPKTYRHASLDAQLTKHRTLAEAKLLQRLGYLGVNVPEVIHVDFRQGIIWMEDIVGNDQKRAASQDVKEEMRGSLKNWIWDYEAEHGEQSITEQSADVQELLNRVGQEIGKLHMNDIVHGDLTTSNLLLRPSGESESSEIKLEPVLIDFGLGSVSTLAEDKAVDLYVLERAVDSTHPVNAEIYNKWLLDGYCEYSEKAKGGSNKIKEVMKKLQDVRLRGRKRSMIG